MSRVTWAPCYRLISARLPRIDIFEMLVPPEDLVELLEIEALTNTRLNDVMRPIAALPREDRITGPGASYVMGAFAYPSNQRFSDRTAGAYYAAEELGTAIAEISYHRARLAARTPTPPMDFDERIIEANIDVDLHDLRFLALSHPIYHRSDYGSGQALAKTQREAGANGLVYSSVRRLGGDCVAIFRPRYVSNARTAGYLGLRWDGNAITDAYRKASLTTTYPDT